jgi:hypothetical protein
VLLTNQQFELYPEWSRAIESDSARAAFHYLVGIAASSRRFVCHAQWKGEVRDFRFIEVASGEQPHSFITNQQWLLFYFRPPAVRSSAHSRDKVAKSFDSFRENPAGEWTVRLASVSDVQVLSDIIDWQ